jgi:Spy/CpxP family protein refolding chaperone
MKRLFLTLILAILAWSTPVLGADSTPPADDPVGQTLYPPELVMQHAAAIGLDDTQRTAIREAIHGAQTKFLDFQWELQARGEKLVQQLRRSPIDETAALEQLDQVLALEREVKRTQIGLLVRIKNLLREPQQAKLDSLRKGG